MNAMKPEESMEIEVVNLREEYVIRCGELYGSLVRKGVQGAFDTFL